MGERCSQKRPVHSCKRSWCRCSIPSGKAPEVVMKALHGAVREEETDAGNGLTRKNLQEARIAFETRRIGAAAYSSEKDHFEEPGMHLQGVQSLIIPILSVFWPPALHLELLLQTGRGTHRTGTWGAAMKNS